MLDIQGASYIVKAPNPTSGNYYLQSTVQFSVNGSELSEVVFTEADKIPETLSSARTWLIDILVWPDWFSSEEKGFAYAFFVTPLDGDKEWYERTRSFFEYPDDIKSDVFPIFTLFQPNQHQVVIDKNIPLARYHNPYNSKQNGTDQCEITNNSEIACVFYVRVQQKDHAPNEKN